MYIFILFIIDKFAIIHRGLIKKQFLLYKKLFSQIQHHLLLNKYVLHNFFAFHQTLIVIKNKKQLKTIQQTEKKKKCTSFLGVCIMSSIALCDTISK